MVGDNCLRFSRRVQGIVVIPPPVDVVRSRERGRVAGVNCGRFGCLGSPSTLSVRVDI